jgi:transcriptional regulator with XRE-family HTH domain
MISLRSATEIAKELAQRVRARRLQRRWTQSELACRAGLKPSTYILFERTGRIAVLRLVKILEVLDLANEFDQIGRHEDLAGMTLAQITQPKRRRGTHKRSRTVSTSATKGSEFELLDRHANELNVEGNESAEYQATSDVE